MKRLLFWGYVLLLVSGLMLLTGCDYGGDVRERDAKIRSIAAAGTFRALPMECYSSCTMEIGLYRQGLICVYPNARFHFHGTMKKINGEHVPIFGDEKDKYDEWVGKHYPPNLKRWWDNHARWTVGLTNFETLTGQQIHDMDNEVPLC